MTTQDTRKVCINSVSFTYVCANTILNPNENSLTKHNDADKNPIATTCIIIDRMIIYFIVNSGVFAMTVYLIFLDQMMNYPAVPFSPF